MGAYILRRLLLVIPTLFGVMVINFALTQFVPGGPVQQVIARLEGLEERAGEAIAMLDQRIDRIAKEAQPRAASPHQTAQAQLARYTIRFAESTQPADRESANEVLQRVASVRGGRWPPSAT